MHLLSMIVALGVSLHLAFENISFKMWNICIPTWGVTNNKFGTEFNSP